MTKISKVITKFIATSCYTGYFPFAPGTIGSAIGLVICWLTGYSIILYLATGIVLLLAGYISSEFYAKDVKQKDPHEITIDEASSVFIAFLFIPFSIKTVIAGFILYRIFDIIKPPPIKKLEMLPGGLGIMADDMMAAIYTNIVLRILF